MVQKYMFGKHAALLKMPSHQLPRRARDGPISATYGVYPANNEAQNMISLKYANCAKTMKMKFHLLDILAQIHVLSYTTVAL